MTSTTAPSASAATLARIRENPPAFLKVPDVATLLECHPSNVYKMVANGALPVQRFGKAIRISTAAFLAFIDGEA
ncbi:excisionase family DNA binding protein [Microbacterium sp. W4I4]|uniref:helix-turn-helix domain-containing protein n=1 Tax=Microbacterium sp. W4I4 TaxID=3042295 RepID=UPI00277F36A5|nr:helix-turn-helix domain-containing protein [Microbacterium sp. W4I4]MDQ0614808.1 excisionase family DNA binding protein [Microbacterium sp. W4I4]